MEDYRVQIYKGNDKVSDFLLRAESPYDAVRMARKWRDTEDDSFAAIMVAPIEATFQPYVEFKCRS